MIILVDSREQRPLDFKCDYRRKSLKFGDYGAMFSTVYQYPVVFERKSIGDLFGSLTFGYDRFRRMFARAEKAKFKVIIAIEGTREKVLKGYPHSSRDPESVLKQLETIKIKYGVDYMFFVSRAAMANFIVEYYTQYFMDYNKTVESAEIIANSGAK